MTLDYSRREPSSAEERANSISHGLGLVASLIAAPVLVITAIRAGGASTIIGSAVFAMTMVGLYLASTLYHSLPETRGKGFLRSHELVEVVVQLQDRSQFPFVRH